MIKLVINNCFGGFLLSDIAIELYKQLYRQKYKKNCRIAVKDLSVGYKIPRHDPILIKVIELLGTTNASGKFSELIITEINSMSYRIINYNGKEKIETPFDINWINVDPNILLQQ